MKYKNSFTLKIWECECPMNECFELNKIKIYKYIKLYLIMFFIFIFLCIMVTAGSALAMSVTLKDGSVYDAEFASGADNGLIIDKNGTGEVISVYDVKSICFSDRERDESDTAAVKTAAVEIPADIKEILDKVPDKSKFPDAGGYIIKDEDIYTLNADGTYKIRSHYIFKIFEDRAIDNNIIIGYAFERESVKIEMGRTIQPDGSVSVLNQADVKIGDMFAGAQFYTNTYKVLSAALPDVKKGSIIEYVIEKNIFKPIMEGYFCPAVYFIAGEPKHICRVEIRTPKNKKLFWMAKNFDNIYDPAFENLKKHRDPVITETDKEKIYTYEIKDIAELISEPSMPSYKDALPYVQFSAFETWDPVYNWFNNHFNKHVMDISDEMRKKTEEIIRGLVKAEDKIAAIYHYIQQQNRYISIKGDLVAGLTGHGAKHTFDNKYGDCVDKAILMTAMLKIAGVDSYPSLINAGGPQWQTDVPHLSSNHSISFVTYDSKEIFLDATSQDSRFPFFRADDHGRNNMIPQLKKFVKSSMPLSVQKNHRRVVINGDGGISVTGRRWYEGAFEYWARMANKSLKESEIKDSYKQRLNVTLPGVELKKIEYTDLMNLNEPVVETVEYNAPDAVIIAGDLMLFSVPGYKFEFNEVSLEERKYPLDYQYLTRTENVFEFVVPEGYKVTYKPPVFEVKNKYIEFRAEYEVKDASTIVFKDSFERKERFVDVKDYKSYKKDLESISKYAGEKVVMNKIK